MKQIKTVNLLPEFARSIPNTKFLGATLDQLVSEPNFLKINGYVGRSFAPTYKSGDNYLIEPTRRRQQYQLEPSVVVTNDDQKVIFFNSYEDLLNKIEYYGGNVENHSRLFSNTAYSFNGLVDFDKIVNFNQYYWLPTGPDPIDVYSGAVDANEVFEITHNTELSSYQFSGRGEVQNPDLILVRGGTYQFQVNQDSDFWIQTEPGVEGTKRGFPNINVRDVFGVTDNGRSNGTIVFNVPQSDAQDYYRKMPFVHPGAAFNHVDFVATGKFTDIDHHLLSHVLNNNYFDGINTSIGGKYIIFVENDFTDDSWTELGVYALRPYDSDVIDGSYAQADDIPLSKRTGIWQVNLEDTGTGDPLIHLNYIMDIPVEHKVFVKSGAQYGGVEFYKNREKEIDRVPYLTAHLDTLFYNDGSDQKFYGRIRIVEMNSFYIDVEKDIIGKTGYKSPNGVTLSNGMKIRFDTMVTPNTYSEGIFYVEGVGTSIRLIRADNLVTPEFEQNATYVPFDTYGYSIDQYDQIISGPKDPDYITINRSSQDSNPWSRSNRWFHEDILVQTAKYNNKVLNLDYTLKAARPIIEFDPNIKLVNHGKYATHKIDILDLTTENALVEVEGDVGAYYENLTLKDGTTVIFANDFDPIVRNRIYTVQIVDISGQLKVHLIPREVIKTDDSVVPIKATVVPLIPLTEEMNDDFAYNPSYRRIQKTIELLPQTELVGVIGINTGIVEGCNFWFDGVKWREGQKKLKVNQPPLFEVYDDTGISFADTTKYPNSSFIGSKIFSYKLGYGNDDPILGFPLKYRNFNNVGDIEFENDFDVASFSFLNGIKLEKIKVNTGYIPSIVDGERRNIWKTVSEKTKQFQNFPRLYNGKNNFFEIDILPEETIKVQNLKVFVNNKLLSKTNYSLERVNQKVGIKIPSGLKNKDRIDILVYSKQVSSIGYYDIPQNWNLNSLNNSFSTLTLGQFRNHLQEISNNTNIINGHIFGYNNIRDLDIKEFGGSILQHSAPAIYSSLFLMDGKVNFIDSLIFAQQEYTRFKNKFLESFTLAVDNLLLNDIPAGVDFILAKLNEVKNSKSPWYYSDMVPYDTNRTIIDYTVLNAEIVEYEIDDKFDDTVLSNKAILVYLDGVQLLKDHDYYFSKIRPSIVFTKPLVYNQQITITVFNNTDGCFIPETPTKLGLYPKFKPEIYLDHTFQKPTYVLRGHDGSITPIFGDPRDKLLLELETRIYNNIKIKYDQQRFDINQFIPGRFRNTEYSKLEFDNILTGSFMNWVGINKLDFNSNNWFKPNNSWTWTYNQFHDIKTEEQLPGWWRGIYNYYFGTDCPNTRPWEMLGFSEMPTWWVETYGIAPYTGGNLVLWKDIEQGLIRHGDRQGIAPIYARPGITKLLPVSVEGDLIPPHAFAVKDFSSLRANGPFSIGDEGPVETAWRRSSDYPFAIQRALALMKPGVYFGQLANVNSYSYDKQLKQFVVNSTKQRVTPIDIKVNNKENKTAGYINWIADYLTSLNIDPVVTLRSYLDKLNIQLGYKVAGFTDKNYLRILAEQSSPSSLNESIIIPDENYKVHLHKTSPVDKIVYSAVIVEKTSNGYSVSGYNIKQPYFTIIPSDTSGNSRQIVIVNVTASIYENYERVKMTVPYGYQFSSKQQVVDFLISYQRYLQSIGFIFSNFNREMGVEQNWELSAKEFLTWSQQGWEVGSVLVLSPVFNYIKTFNANTVVDEISNFPESSKIVDVNYNVVDSSKFNIIRDKGEFILEANPNITIGLAELSLVQYEHALIFDNETVFKDVIYKPELGNRQYRLKLVGNKTGDWHGQVAPPGFIFANDDIPSWNTGTDFRKGTLVRYKGFVYTALQDIDAMEKFDFNLWSQVDRSKIKSGLLPNLSYNAKKFEYMYDVENQISDQNINKFANGLIGFRDRSYLNDLSINSTTQTKFYQGYIKEKGTKSSIVSLTNASFSNLSSDVSFKEEWAFRVGEYGATESDQFFEVQLSENKFLSNPIAFTLLNTQESSASENVVGIYKETLYKKPLNFKTQVFNTRGEHSDYRNDILTAGYVNTRDIDATLFDINDITSLTSTITSVGNGYKIWVAKDFQHDWNVYRVDETTIGIVNIRYDSNSSAVITFNEFHLLKVNDLFVIKSFNTIFNGFYKVQKVINEVSITVLVKTRINTLENNFVGYGKLFNLRSIRYEYLSDAVETPERDWKETDKIWVNKANSKNEWAVYEKNIPWKYNDVLRNPTLISNGNMGHSISINKDSRIVLASSPKSINGEVVTYVRTNIGYLNSQRLDSTIVTHVYSATGAGTEGWAPVLNVIVNRTTNTITIEITNLPITARSRLVKWAGNVSDIYDFLQDNSNDNNLIIAGSNYFIRENIPTSKFNENTTLDVYVDTLFVGSIVIKSVYATNFGNSTAIANKTAVITANDELLGGIAQVYSITQSGVLNKSQQLYNSDSTFGNNVVLSEDSQWLFIPVQNKVIAYTKTLSIDTTFDNETTTFDKDKWFSKIKEINAPKLTAKFGYSLATNNDATVLVVGAPYEGNTGAVYVYTRYKNNFTLAQTIIPENISYNARFGESVCFSNNYTEILIGAPGYVDRNYHSGIVYRYICQTLVYNTILCKELETNVDILNGASLVINGKKIDFIGSDLAPGTLSPFIGSPSNPHSILGANIIGLSATIEEGKLRFTYNAPSSPHNLTIHPYIVENNPLDVVNELGLELFTHVQIIKHPYKHSMEGNFGTKITSDLVNGTIFVTSKNAPTLTLMKMDNSITTFDNNSTYFTDRISGTGAVYVYDFLNNYSESINTPSKLGFTQQLTGAEVNTGDDFGCSIAASNKVIMIGAQESDYQTFAKLRFDVTYGSTIIYVDNISKFPLIGVIYIGSEKVEYGQKVVESVDDDIGYITLLTRNTPAKHFKDDNIIQVNAGKIFEFDNLTNTRGWELIRKQQPTVDLDNINKLYIYDKKTQTVLANLDYIDPVKGKILGAAEQEINFKTAYDPASYNIGKAEIASVDDNFYWNATQVGQVWWDLSTVRFIDYEQDELEYRIQTWGNMFPGSSIDVYEWVKSDVLPSNYTNGIPKYRNNEAYVQQTIVDKETGVIIPFYYFWAKNRTDVDLLSSRRLPVKTIAELIESPRTQGIPYAEIIRDDSIVLRNSMNFISANNTILHVDYSILNNKNIIHNEYEMVQENAEHTFLPNKIVSKLIDSITGADKSGNMVPDYTLNEAERYGISIRPRQSMVINKVEAARNLVHFVNTVFSKTPVSFGFNLEKLFDFEKPPLTWDPCNINLTVADLDELSYVDKTVLKENQRILVFSDKTFDGQWAIYEFKNNVYKVTRSQSYRTTDYWQYVDWFDSSYDPTVKPSYTVNTEKDVTKLRYSAGKTIKVRNNGKFIIYLVNNDLTLKVVAIQNGTIKLKDSLWAHDTNQIGFSNDTFDTVRFDLNPTIEFRNIMEALKDDIFVNTLDSEFSNMFFMLLNYIMTEQRVVDWAFKTSFVSVVHKLRKLEQFPNYIKDNQSYYEEYINEVKPYRTKIREYTIEYEKLDQAYVKASDFDLPSYFDNSYGVWRSPNNEHARDPLLLVIDPKYADWTLNHTLHIDSVDIIQRGFGYSAPPKLTVVGGGGIDAVLEAVIDYYTGSIYKVIVKNPGYGYTSTPTILVEGDGVVEVKLPNGTTQTIQSFMCSPIMKNNTVRKFNTTVKFDRIAYSLTILQWKPNEEYFQGETVSHNGALYLVPQDMFADNFFDPFRYVLLDSSLIESASERVSSLYAPKLGMTPADVKQLFYGTEYPGTHIEGFTFIHNEHYIDTTVDNGHFTDVDIVEPSDVFVDGGDFIDTYESHSPEELIPGIMFDTLDIQVFTLDPNAQTDEEKQANPIGFRVSKTMNRETTFLTLLLAKPFTKDDTVMYLDDVSELVSHSFTSGVVYIGGEAISYTEIDTVNKSLRGLTRHLGEYKYDRQQYFLSLIYKQGSIVTVSYVDDEVNTKPWEFRRISKFAMSTLAQELKYDDENIYLVDVSGFPEPSKRSCAPGVIYINGEKIHYYTIDYENNMLGQLRRGVWGTGTPLVHNAGLTVADASVVQEIPGDSMHKIMLNLGMATITDTSGIFGSITPAGLFLKEQSTMLPLMPGQYNDIEDPNADTTRFDDNGEGELFTPIHPFDADPFDSYDPG